MNANSPTAYFSVNLSDATGSLQRFLGVVRRRGFDVENMLVTRNPNTEGYRVEVRLKGGRSFETLARHLANLFDVFTVSLLPPSASIEFTNKVTA